MKFKNHKRPPGTGRSCLVAGCDKDAPPSPRRSGNGFSYGRYCAAHAKLNNRYGTPTPYRVCVCGTQFEFMKNGAGAKYCPPCKKIAGRVTTAVNNHGIAPIDYLNMYNNQGGVCAIEGCFNTDLHIDHNHKHCPGESGCKRCVRSLLCHGHNVVLGWIEKHNMNMDGLKNYIAKHEMSSV